MQLIKIVKSNLAAMHKQIKADLFNLSFIHTPLFIQVLYILSKCQSKACIWFEGRQIARSSLPCKSSRLQIVSCFDKAEFWCLIVQENITDKRLRYHINMIIGVNFSLINIFKLKWYIMRIVNDWRIKNSQNISKKKKKSKNAYFMTCLSWNSCQHKSTQACLMNRPRGNSGQDFIYLEERCI